MMDSLRTTVNGLALKTIFSIIIVSFMLTGVSGYLIGGDNNYAMKVNDQEISRGQFENVFNSERNRMQQQLGDQYSELAANEGYMKALRQQVLNRLIDEALLNQYARELKLGISDEQVKQAISATPVFQVDDRFGDSRYNGILNQMGMIADQYARTLRNQLTTRQLINGVAGTDFMLKGETDELVVPVAQQRVVREVTIDANVLVAKQLVIEQETASYYEQNKNNLMMPEQFRVSHVKLDAATMQQPVSDADTQSCYDQHQDQFTQPQRTRHSITQIKTKDEAKAVLDELNKGGDSAALVEEKSADTISACNGDDMGWLEGATISDELKSAGLEERGRLSGVIKSSAGFLIVRLDDIQSAKVKSLDEARDDIVAKVKYEKALDAYYTLQQKVSDAASNDTESPVGAEQAAGVKATQTGWFSKDNLLEELNFKSVADAIFNGGLVGENGAPGINSDIITVDGDRALMLRISEHKLGAVKPLADVQEQVKVLVQYNKVEQQAKVNTEKLPADLKADKGVEAMQVAGPKFGEPKTLSRSGRDPVNQAALVLPLPTKDKLSYDMAIDMQGNVVLLALGEVKQGLMPEDQKKAMAQDITQNNAQTVFEALISNLRKEAKIKIGDVLEQQ